MAELISNRLKVDEVKQ